MSSECYCTCIEICHYTRSVQLCLRNCLLQYSSEVLKQFPIPTSLTLHWFSYQDNFGVYRLDFCQRKQKQKLRSRCTRCTPTPYGDMVKPMIDPPSRFLSWTWRRCSHQGMGLNLAKHNTLKLKQWSWKQLSTKCFDLLICFCCTRCTLVYMYMSPPHFKCQCTLTS